MTHEILAPGIEIYQADCMDVMPTFEDGAFDAVITDIPYGEKIHNMSFTNNVHGGVTLRNDYSNMADWDNSIDDNIFNEIFRVSKNQLIFGGNFYKLPPSRCWLIWDKKQGGYYSNDFADVEMAWTNLDAPARLINHLWHGMIQQDMKNKEKRYHPTQKPLPVMVRAIEMMTDKGDTTLDAYMGTGTTGVAAVQTGRRFTGIEIDEGYYNIAKSRIQEALMQPRLL